jgi:uncharacterized protein
MKIIGFDWDEGNSQKCQSHGVSLHEIEQAFEGAQYFDDVKHSKEEKRFILINKTLLSRFVFIVFTLRFTLSGIVARPISARYMHSKELKKYEKTGTK